MIFGCTDYSQSLCFDQPSGMWLVCGAACYTHVSKCGCDAGSRSTSAFLREHIPQFTRERERDDIIYNNTSQVIIP